MDKFVEKTALVIVFLVLAGILFCVGKAVVDGADMTMPMDGTNFVLCLVGIVAIVFFFLTDLGRGIGSFFVAILVGYAIFCHAIPWLWHALTSSPDSLVR